MAKVSTPDRLDSVRCLTETQVAANEGSFHMGARGFDELREFFLTIKPPYTLHDIYGFNAIYKLAYPNLSRDERWRSEQFVEVLIENVERPEWVCRIFGVV